MQKDVSGGGIKVSATDEIANKTGTRFTSK